MTMLFQNMISSIDIHLLAFGINDLTSDWNYTDVNSFFNRILYIRKGSTSVRHHGNTYELTQGDIHLIPCHTTADYICLSDGFQVQYLHFTSRTIGGIDICKIHEYEYTRTVRKIDLEIYDHLKKLNPDCSLPEADPSTDPYRLFHDTTHKHYHDLLGETHLENTGCISILLAPFLSTAPPPSASRSEGKRLQRFASYVEDHLEQPIALRDIAEELGITPNYLSDWLFQIIRMRPVEYINLRKIEKAQELLTTSTLSVKQIAFQLGFSSTTYFARVFKNQLGVSASTFRVRNS
jgi:AraC-like DNA-binding protein